MADSKISALPAAGSISSTDVFPLVRGGATVKGTFGQLTAFLGTQGFNFVPVAGVDATTISDTTPSVSGNVLSNDSDQNVGQTLTITSLFYDGEQRTVGSSFFVAYGTFSLQTDGSYNYVLGAAARALNLGDTANEVFTYTAADGAGGLATTTLTITITGTNGVPVLQGDVGVAPIDVTVTGDVLANDFDPESQTLTITHFTVTGFAQNNPGDTRVITGKGSLTVNSNGTFTFVPLTAWAGTAPSVDYELTDGTNVVHGTLTLGIFVDPNSSIPSVLYTDSVSGPISGGENNLGCYLSIFGQNFGSQSGLGTTTKVYIGGVEVANYRYLGLSKVGAKLGIQQLTVQVGSLGNPTLDVSLPVKVVVSGVDSNSDHLWTPCSGRVLFVSLSGNDDTAVVNDITHPWRHLQDAAALKGAYFPMAAGDHVVIRGGSWSDTLGVDTTWLRFSANAYARNGGVRTWIHFTAYPGPINGNAIEDVHYTTPSLRSGGFAGPWSAIAGTSGEYISISNLRMEIGPNANRDASPFNFQYTAGPWRVINNEVGPWVAGSAATLNAAGVTGHGVGMVVIGNHIHDIEGTSALQNHGIYADTTATNWDIFYNWIHDVSGGSLIQFNDNEGGAGSFQMYHGGTWEGFTGIKIHHNWLENAAKYGINFNDELSVKVGRYDVQAYNNVIIGTQLPPFRINSTQPIQTIWWAYNTVYNCVTTSSGTGNAYIRMEGFGTGSQIRNKFFNNIFAFGPDTISTTQWFLNAGLDSPPDATTYDLKRNVYFSNGLSPTAPSTYGDSLAIVADPQFTNVGTSDLTLQPTSPCINAGTYPLPSGFYVIDDFTGTISRKMGGAPDVGAFELFQATPYVISSPVISSAHQVGTATTITDGTWGNSPVGAIVKQWTVDDVDVPGATAGSYTPTGSQWNQVLKCRLTGSNAAGSTSVTITAGTVTAAAGAPAFTSNPSITGTPQQGQTLTRVQGGTTGTVESRSYRWFRGSSVITGATGTTYLLTAGDVGSQIKVEETLHNSTLGGAIATSSVTATVTASAADPVVVQTKSGFISQGSTTDIILDNPVTPNSYLLIVYTGRETTMGLGGLTDSRGTVLTSQDFGQTNDLEGGGSCVHFKHFKDTVGGSYTLTSTPSVLTGQGQVHVLEISGVDQTTFYDIAGATSSGHRFDVTADVSLGSATTKAKDLMVAVAMCAGSASTITPTGSGWSTLISEQVGRTTTTSVVMTDKPNVIGIYDCPVNVSDGGAYPCTVMGILAVKGS